MPQPKSRRRDAPALPPVTVARFEQVTLLIERLAREKTSVFLAAMRDYQDQHREATARPLTHTEAVGAATSLAQQLGRDDPARLAADIQASGLQASDRPDSKELLLAAGVRTAPAFLDVALRVCALIEIDADTFELDLEQGTLDMAIDDHVKVLRKLSMPEARARAAAALQHFASEGAGVSLGEAVRLLTGTVWQALQEALDGVTGSASSSSTDLLTPTGGASETSSTD